jgi:hypothetical protein
MVDLGSRVKMKNRKKMDVACLLRKFAIFGTVALSPILHLGRP